MNTISIRVLRKLCLKYDVEYGPYPENQYEGGAIFSFILEEIEDRKDIPSFSEWVDDLHKLNDLQKSDEKL